ncbi:MAG TPA: response regulator [Phycisphaerales bacterium]|nr:response regulator [Phycisphaerales bacterium]
MRPPTPADPGQTQQGPGGRLNLLLSAAYGPGPGGWSVETWADQLPRLLEPLGVKAWAVRSGREAAEAVRRTPIHLAVVDLSLPMDTCCGPASAAAGNVRGNASVNQAPSPATAEEAGCRLLELLARQPSPPPTILIRPRRTRGEDSRLLAGALRAGAFAVLDRPVHLEALLEALRRALRRHYADRWPGVG